MKRTYLSFGATALVGLLSLSLAACGSDNPTGQPGASDTAAQSTLSGTLEGGGASSQGSAQNAWRAGFQQANPKVTVNYAVTDSGAGRKNFLSGSFQFAGSDSALSTDSSTGTSEVDQAKTRCNAGNGINLPVYVSPIAIAFNISGVTTLNLQPATVAKIFNGKITTWSDPEILADNAAAKDALAKAGNITPVHRSDDSGTSKNFGEYLAKAAGDAWPYPAANTWPVTGGQSGNGTSGVVQVINAAQGTIGYADASAIGTLGKVSVKSGSDFVAPTADAAAKTVDASPRDTTRAANDIVISIDRKPTVAGAYPAILISYLIVCDTYSTAAEADLVKGYATFVASEAAQASAATAAGSAPISSTLRTDIAKSVSAIKSK